MPRAIFNGTVVAESDDYEVVEGNVYFPPDSIKTEYFKDSNLHTTCSWKGVASYYTLEVGDEESTDAAWYYPEALPAADNIKGYVAFYPVVTVER